jgi:dTDP-4-dehydrorhamnose reductase
MAALHPAIGARTRWFLTGGGGQLATAFEGLLEGEVFVAREAVLDLRDAPAVAAAVHAFRPDVVLHTAAYTDVDGAETDETTARAVNVLGTRHLVAAVHGTHAQVVSFSSDYVFDGRKGAPYVEHDEPHPLNAYGRTKLAQERETLAWPHGTVIRTAWLFSATGRNFVKTILAAARERAAARVAGHPIAPLRVVDDQVGSPTCADHLAAAVLEALHGGLGAGIYHMAGRRRLQLVRAGPRGRGAGRPCGHSRGDHHDASRPAGAAAGLQRAGQRARHPAAAPWQDGVAAVIDELLGAP